MVLPVALGSRTAKWPLCAASSSNATASLMRRPGCRPYRPRPAPSAEVLVSNDDNDGALATLRILLFELDRFFFFFFSSGALRGLFTVVACLR